MTILVVDDELGFRLVMKSLLSDDGHEVLLAEDGEEALEKLDEIPIDLVISDIYMPVMDGFKFHKALRSSEKWANMPVLFVSAYDDQHTRDVIQNPRLDAFVKKGRPSSEIKEWIAYLTAPEEERKEKYPGSRFGNRPKGF
jgi:CheY-like chemotaxis protein